MSCQERPTWAKSLPDGDFDLAARGIFTVKAAAAYAKVSEALIRKQIKMELLPAFSVGKGFRIRKRDLDLLFGFTAL